MRSIMVLFFMVMLLTSGCAKTSSDLRSGVQPSKYVVDVPIEVAFENSYRALRGCVGGSNANGSFYSASRSAEMEYAINMYGNHNTIALIDMHPTPDDKTTITVYGNLSSKSGKTLFEQWALGSMDCGR